MPITLSGVVHPENATFRDIRWELQDGANATLFGNVLMARERIIVRAVIDHGLIDSPYIHDFVVEATGPVVQQTSFTEGQNAFFSSTGNYDDLSGVWVNDTNFSLHRQDGWIALGHGGYAIGRVESGSPFTVALYYSYLNTLENGDYMLHLMFSHGGVLYRSVYAMFSIRQSQVAGESNVPQTGDGANMVVWLALLTLSVAGIASMAIMRRKHESA
jgi:hypothetical protein